MSQCVTWQSCINGFWMTLMKSVGKQSKATIMLKNDKLLVSDVWFQVVTLPIAEIQVANPSLLT